MAKKYIFRSLKNTLLLVLAIILFSCGNTSRIEEAQKELLQVDIDHSNLSKKEGRHKSSAKYIHPNSVYLKPQKEPIVGKNAILNILSRNEDAKAKLSWQPTKAIVSKSGDLGYTFGTYKMKKRRKVSHGTYVTIWGKNEEGKWKFVLKSANEGLGNQE
ncbi:MAG: DUF4440 domain-containing protein [Bacteroidetes bacterium]|jgi:ketosteroid isomerase-like protein|nr:DUF4440 domain-containing protein [Bacteroidota bacterium]MBT6686501.1 DUF4440 domain-containing protein [Bacteroidota bacterium]MBT7144240.1 DUF4440 domain-containing protein [Bacteroidota bacterium]MBT7491344.1 DUF4440 domain-containing protein [Bacteroidota bacterium]